MILLFSTVFAADCPAGATTTATVQRQVDAAEIAFVELNEAELDANRNAAVRAVNCLGELIHPTHAGAFLRLEGSYAFVRGNSLAALTAFRAALSVQPNFQVNAAMAPPGGPLHTLYEEAKTQPASTWSVPKGNAIYVNGTPSQTAPDGFAILQYVDADGRVVFSGIASRTTQLPPPPPAAPRPPEGRLPLPTDPVDLIPKPPENPKPVPVTPPVVAAPPPQLPALPDPLQPTSKKNGAKIGLLGASGGMAVVAAGLFAGSAVSRGRYDAGPTAKRRQLTNSLYAASIGAGIVTAGLLTVAIALPAKKKPKEDDGLY